MVTHENILGVRDTAHDTKTTAPASLISIRTSQTAGIKRKMIDRVEVSPEEKLRKEEARAARAEALAISNTKIFVGVDFGTTYSGVAYVSSGKQAKDVDVLTNWTGGQNELLEKVPSRIAYQTENNFDRDLWGYQVETDMVCVQWFKLLLDQTTNPTDFDDPLLEKAIGKGMMRLPAGKTAQDVTRDYLRFLYNHIMTSLRDMMGRVAVMRTPIVFELTLPATWSHAAREATRNAAIDAGFQSRNRDKIVLIDEPEAAAISVLRNTVATFDGAQPFKPKQSVLVVDMGGGTVDLCTFNIKKVDPLQLEEACVGEGGKCGGTTIDRELLSYLDKTFGPAFKALAAPKIMSGSEMMNKFELIKRNFRGCDDEDKVYELPLLMRKVDPDDENLKHLYDPEERRVRFTSADLKEMFEPVIVKTLVLIREQIRRTRKAGMPAIKTLCLAGGLGSSPYVKKCIDAFVENELKGKIEVISPRKPWSAIAHGAAIRALEKEPVLFRRSRDHIGICVHEAWDARKHDLKDYWHSPIFGERARNQMRWHVCRGEKIRPTTKKTISCCVGIEKVGKDNKAVIIYQDIYACSDDVTPTRLEDGIEPKGRIKIDLTNIIYDESKKIKKANGKASASTFDIDVKIEMTVASDKGILEVKGRVGRKTVGSATIEWFADPEAPKA